MHEERRGYRRILQVAPASIQLRRADGGNPVSGVEIAKTQTRDVSAEGLRLWLTEQIEPDCLFELCIEEPEQGRCFLLAVESRWCGFDADHGRYEAGFAILDGLGTDFAPWMEKYLNTE